MASKKKTPWKEAREQRKAARKPTNGVSLLEAAKSAPVRAGHRTTGFKPEELDQRVELALAYMTGAVAASQVQAALNIENVGQFASQALWAGVRSGRWTIQRAK